MLLEENNLTKIELKEETLMTITNENIFLSHYISKWIDLLNKYYDEMMHLNLENAP